MGDHELIAVLGTKGAPGATTVAIRLARDLAIEGRPASLLDLDPEGGDLVAFLGLDPKRNLFTLAHLVGSREIRVDDLRAEGHEVGGGLIALTGLPRREMADALSSSLVSDLLEAACEAFPVVVCDVGRNPVASAVLPPVHRADLLLLVARADLVGIWNAERTLAALPPELRGKTSLVVSRMRRGESHREVAAALGIPLAGVIPFDAVEARRATSDQRAIRGRPGRAIREVARRITQRVESAPATEPAPSEALA